ncbi:MAG: NAD-dependent epimerase/dehydratase family protein [Ilumatobacter sp.]|nr:NAD-dependent epimerase/dehydratase family protein [Ilumatobacter sp.]
MRVLVTGGTSLIGRHLVEALPRAGHEVTTLQRGVDDVNPSLRGSVTDRAAAAQACEGRDAVVHLAAKVGVTGDWSDYEHVNVGGTTTMIEAARHAGVKRFVHVSSPSVAHAGEPLIGAGAGPADPEHTRGHYATSKALAEIVALEASSEEMPVVAVRPHLVWGPGDTQLIGRIVDRARQGRLALVGSGSALIDTTYVTNCADALVAAVERAPDLGGRAFVVSNGEPRTVKELVERIVSAAGLDATPRRVPTPIAFAGGKLVERLWDRSGRTDDPPMTSFLAEQLSTAHWFDQRETRQALQWRPAVTLEEGFTRLTESFG